MVMQNFNAVAELITFATHGFILLLALKLLEITQLDETVQAPQ